MGKTNEICSNRVRSEHEPSWCVCKSERRRCITLCWHNGVKVCHVMTHTDREQLLCFEPWLWRRASFAVISRLKIGGNVAKTPFRSPAARIVVVVVVVVFFGSFFFFLLVVPQISSDKRRNLLFRVLLFARDFDPRSRRSRFEVYGPRWMRLGYVRGKFTLHGTVRVQQLRRRHNILICIHLHNIRGTLTIFFFFSAFTPT